MPVEPDPQELVALAERIGRDAARLIVGGLHEFGAVASKSTPTDLVTEMDRAAERLIADALAAARPGDGFVGEEGTDRRPTTGVEWFVDPIDGTINYVYALPGFAVSIGATYEGRTLAGCVVDALRGHVHTAAAGGGARRDGKPIACSGKADLATALVATGFSYEPERRRRQAGVLTRVLPTVRDIRRLGSASMDLCHVASGQVDAYYERGLNRWDFTAGELIAREAGARTGNLTGGPLDQSFALAAAPAIFDELADLLRDAGAADA